MRENRRTYRVSGSSVAELNFVLAQIADRLDQLEGFRGTPEFQAAPDMGGNRITNVGTPTDANDAVPYGTVTTIEDTLDTSISAVQSAQTGYLNKAGLSGGQNAYGGTGSGDDLILRSTSHADKGWTGYADSDGTVLHGWYG